MTVLPAQSTEQAESARKRLERAEIVDKYPVLVDIRGPVWTIVPVDDSYRYPPSTGIGPIIRRPRAVEGRISPGGAGLIRNDDSRSPQRAAGSLVHTVNTPTRDGDG